MRDWRAEFQELIKRETEALSNVIKLNKSDQVKQALQEWDMTHRAVSDFLSEYDLLASQEKSQGRRLSWRGLDGADHSNIPAYKTVEMVDIVYQPGAADPPGEVMEADMVCNTIVGELEVTAGEQKFTAKEGDVWACGKGSTKEAATNKGSEAAVMRVIMMHV